MSNTSINVNLWGKCIGKLCWCPNIHNTLFTFTNSYLDNNLNAFPLIADKEYARTHNSFYGIKEPLYKKLPSFLSESLPDSWKREYIVNCYNKIKINTKEVTPIEKLIYIRNRCLGALEYEMSNFDGATSLLGRFCQIADEYEGQLKEITIPSLYRTNLSSICLLGTCSVGLRPKVLLAINRESGEVRSGQIKQGINYDYYILKMGDSKNCLAEIEMSFYQTAVNAGIQMMPSMSIHIDGISHFLTKRFDRVKGEKLHVQSFAALAPRSSSYEDLFDIAVRLKLAKESIVELYRRLLFNILMNNVDDHPRNFSFIMDANGKWSLSPAYDISYPFIYHDDHYMTLNGKKEGFNKDDILSIANAYKISNHEEIYNKILSAVSVLNEILEKYGVYEKYNKIICKRVNENIRNLQS